MNIHSERKGCNRAFILVLFFALVLICPSRLLHAQGQSEVKAAIEKVDKGQGEEVRKNLPDLVARFQNTDGIMYLQGRLATDGIEAVKFYQSVVDNFPKSEWADDALFRIYQYYYSLGLYRTADLKLQQLKQEYPNSPYASGKAAAADLPKQEEPPVKLPTKDTIDVEPQVIPAPVTQTAEPPAQQKDTVAGAPEKSRPAASPVTASSPYTLQVGAFSSAANAQKQKSFFEDLGYTVEVTNKIRSGKSLYLVWVGSYESADEARVSGRELKAKYKIDSMIVERY